MSGVSSGAKGAILGRIRDAVGERPPAADEYPAIVRDYRQAPSLDVEARLARFEDRLVHYQVRVARTGQSGLAAAVAAAAAARGASSLVVPSDLPREWIPPGLRVVDGESLTPAALDVSEGVLTGCSAAIAETGTIVLRHERAEGRRAMTLVPDYHLCVVFAEQVVETVPEAIRLLAQWGPQLVTTISGPSATADIEMTRIRGVHGPRTLEVILVV